MFNTYSNLLILFIKKVVDQKIVNKKKIGVLFFLKITHFDIYKT
jgi:hypothetical protein